MRWALAVLAVLVAALVLIPRERHETTTRPVCICEGPCDPNPCDVMWDSTTGEVLWGKIGAH